jgi:F-type H+-transporting ATPase subunit c
MKMIRLTLLVLAVFFLAAYPVLAQDKKTGDEKAVSTSVVLSGAGIGAGLGAALTIVGAGYGFGRIGASALESMARQPEVAGRIQTAMLIIAALLEGATFFSLIICIQVAGRSVPLVGL